MKNSDKQQLVPTSIGQAGPREDLKGKASIVTARTAIGFSARSDGLPTARGAYTRIGS